MLPGFVDLQVNGYKGIDFSSPNLTLGDINFVSQQLLETGVIGYCPTVISSPTNIYERNLPLLANASDSEVGAQILGIHLEGPFINPVYGPRGIHPEENLIPPSIELFEKFRSWAQDKIVILTLAPELEGALELIDHVVSNSQIVVSIGHMNARMEIIHDAINAGVRAATHIGNALADMISRHDNPLWPILADDRIYGLFITDGSHLPPEMIRVCLRAKNDSKFIVTSDIVHLAGLAPGDYEFHGIPVVILPDGSIRRKGATQHAGAGTSMMGCMNFMASLGELDEAGLRKISFENPLQLLKKEINKEHLSNAPGIVYKDQKFRL